MPTILRENGFAVMIFTNDHGPAHVPVLKAGQWLKVSSITLQALGREHTVADRDQAGGGPRQATR